MPNGNDPTLEALQSGDRQAIAEAVLRRARFLGDVGARQVGQLSRVAGVRTQGIGLQPVIEAGRRRAFGEAQTLATLGAQRSGELFQAEEAAKDRAQRREELAEARAEAARSRRAALQQAAIAGAFGIAAGAAKGAASK